MKKMRSNVVRPETVINQNIDENWRPLLQTPPFPEYTSGHSVSTCSAIMLTCFGDNFATQMIIELPLITARKYKSFNLASQEVMSRFLWRNSP
jgi:hypothetical protein